MRTDEQSQRIDVWGALPRLTAYRWFGVPHASNAQMRRRSTMTGILVAPRYIIEMSDSKWK